jgi:hypothetical protein
MGYFWKFRVDKEFYALSTLNFRIFSPSQREEGRRMGEKAIILQVEV